MVTQHAASRRDRAQLLLITAVVIAAFLLSAVVLLNVLHESPETSSAQDGQSLADTERINAHLSTDLNRYLLAHSADTTPYPGSGNDSDNPANNRVPFAETGEFESDVATFAASYMNLSVANRASVVDVELDTSASDTGAIVWKTNETLVPANETQLQDAEGLPRIQFHIADIAPAASAEIEVEADSEMLFTLDLSSATGSTVETADTDCVDLETPFEVDLVHGVGEVRAANEYCRIDVRDALRDAGTDFNVTVETNLDESGVDDSVEWTYAISGTEATVTDGNLGDPRLDDDYKYDVEYWDRETEDPPLWYKEGVLVDPVFEVTYVDPSIRYETILRLFEDRT